MANKQPSKATMIAKQALTVNPQTQPAQALAYSTPQMLPPALSTMDTTPNADLRRAGDPWHSALAAALTQCGCPLCQDMLALWQEAMQQRSQRGGPVTRAQALQARGVPLPPDLAIQASAALIHQQRLERRRK